jgi:phage/plasmid-like protein (TIGR03299 family)
MSHMIDMSNAQANIAYAGETPWHSLGYAIQPGDDRAVWVEKGGLAHEVRKAPVEFQITGADGVGRSQLYADRFVLYRSDTEKALSVVSKDYKIVQPAQVIGFFDELMTNNGFALETVGSLDGGKRVWALAKVSDGAPVIGQDVVRPYLLLATSYDGSLATIAKFTTVRVVCHNTLTMSAGYKDQKGEDDAGGGTVRIPHTRAFDPKDVKLDLGIVFNAFDTFMSESRRLAKREVNKTFAHEFLKMLLPPPVKTEVIAGIRTVVPAPVEDGKGYQSIMALFQGSALGGDMKEARGTAWGLLNAVTQHVDWQAGRSDNTRIRSAWFGAGDELKTKARNLLLEVVS